MQSNQNYAMTMPLGPPAHPPHPMSLSVRKCGLARCEDCCPSCLILNIKSCPLAKTSAAAFQGSL